MNNNIDWFYIATYHSHGESQTALQSIITPADTLISYIEMLSLQTLHRNDYNSHPKPGTHHTWVR